MAASGDTGESDPATAIQDALQTFEADRIVLFTHGGDDKSYLEDIDPDEIRDRFGLPVDRATVCARGGQSRLLPIYAVQSSSLSAPVPIAQLSPDSSRWPARSRSSRC